MRAARYFSLIPVSLVWICFAGACASPPKTTDVEPIFYPGEPEEPRIQFLTSISSSTDVEETSSFRKFLTGEEPQRLIRRAQGIAWWQGRLYVCDPALNHVIVVNFEGKKFGLLDPKRRRLFKKPVDIAIASDGRKYIIDTEHRLVIVYGADDQYEGKLGDPETWRPVGVAVAGDRLYVTDAANHAVVVFDRTSGEEIKRFGKPGRGPGGFQWPVAISIGPNGDLYVVDSLNFRIQQFKPDGTHVRSIGSVGRTLGQFARPRGVAVDREGRIYALDIGWENCQIFDAEGKLLLHFGTPGGHPGAINMPAAVRVNYDAVETFQDRVAPGHEIECVIFIASQTGPNKVNVYGLLKKR